MHASLIRCVMTLLSDSSCPVIQPVKSDGVASPLLPFFLLLASVKSHPQYNIRYGSFFSIGYTTPVVSFNVYYMASRFVVVVLPIFGFAITTFFPANFLAVSTLDIPSDAPSLSLSHTCTFTELCRSTRRAMFAQFQFFG